MADKDIVGRNDSGAPGNDSEISLAKLVTLCHEIDESWNEAAVQECRDDFYCTDSGFVKLRMVGDWVHLDMIAVEPEKRGEGHGRALVEMAEDVARTMGLKGVAVETIDPEFFQHLGYSVLCVLPGLARGRDLTAMFKEIENVFDR